MSAAVFSAAADLVLALSASARADRTDELHSKWHGYGVKVWFGGQKATPLHYEAQLVNRKHIDGAAGLALEIGFHAELRTGADNDAAMAPLLANEANWRRDLGEDVIAGPFIGSDRWRRLSEVWLDPDLDAEDAAWDIASRLVDRANPVVTLEVGTETFAATATVIDGGPRRDDLYAKLVEISTQFAEYEKMTDRVIPMVVLSRNG